MRRAPILVLALVLPTLLAGCAQEGMPGATVETPPADAKPQTCGSGRVMVGLDSVGAPLCQPPPRDERTAFTCPAGEAVVGFDAKGTPRCAPFVISEREAPPNLQVVGIYGKRPDASATGLDEILVHVELRAGAPPADLSKLVLRYSDGRFMRNHAADAIAIEWVRGDGDARIMEAGDLVQLSFRTEPIPTRTLVALTIIPEKGVPINADFKTPPTYGSDTVITLR